jgi:D-arginine dehydrogenase
LLEQDEIAALRRDLGELRALGADPELLDRDQTIARMPVLTVRDFPGAAWLPRGGRIDVAALLAGYLDEARRLGVTVRTRCAVTAVETADHRIVSVTAGGKRLRCRVLVNAAGAWAGQLAELAGAPGLPLVPYRRTIVTWDPPAPVDSADWPLVAFDARRFYFAPEGSGLLASPMEEVASEPCDARPDPRIVSDTLALVRQFAATLAGERASSARAGLRTFAPDRRPVVGRDPQIDGFFWLAGQGGSGIETSPSLGRIAAEIIATGGTEWPDATLLSPQRFRDT